MPRRGRVIIPGLPHHIVQRGHNKSEVYIEGIDFNHLFLRVRLLAPIRATTNSLTHYALAATLSVCLTYHIINSYVGAVTM